MPKVRPHFKVHVSIRYHAKTQQLYDDPILLSAYVRLGILMIERYAGRTGGTIRLSRGDLCDVTGTRNPGYAVRRMEALARASPLVFERCTEIPADLGEISERSPGDVGEISERSQRDLRRSSAPFWTARLPNFARKQGFLDEDVPTSGMSGDPPIPIPKQKQKQKKKRAVPPAAPLDRESYPLRDLRSRVRAAWPLCVAAAKEYGKDWRSLSAARVSMMSARLRDHPKAHDEILVRAIHGAVLYWGGLEQRGEFDPFRALVPETIFRKANFSKYVEAAAERKEKAPGDRLREDPEVRDALQKERDRWKRSRNPEGKPSPKPSGS